MEWLIPVLIVVALVVIAGIYLWATYNSLVQLNVRVDEAWSDITVQLKRRADLLPNLIEAVKGYAAHEKAVFENVTRARAETLSAAGPADAGVAEGQIGLGTLSLLMNPSQRAELEADPSLLSGAVEEMLRFHTIAHLNSARVATADVMIGDQLIRAGEGVYPLILAANRDPEVFPEPDTFNIHRKPQEHMAFAYGIHQCLGQPLARLELHAIFSTLFKRLPDLRLAVPAESLTYNGTSQVYRLESLPVTW